MLKLNVSVLLNKKGLVLTVPLSPLIQNPKPTSITYCLLVMKGAVETHDIR